MTQRRRLDAELVRRKLVASLQDAQEAIDAGFVVVAGSPATNAARLVAPDESVSVAAPPRKYVSRGGLKLEAALDRFAVDVAGKLVLDAGCSTGGFTDCVLQRGAARVIAVDVGYGVLHDRVRNDSRVTALERTNVRDLALDEPVDVVVADLSFVSLRTVAPALVDARNVKAGADVVALVKPQFEAGREEVSRGKGVIRDPAVWRDALGGARSAMEEAGAAMIDVMVSPLKGADGNVEFLAHIRTACSAAESVDAARLDDVVGGVA